ncbi:hypothetical protein CRE_28924 [Caenorhabditis remanei]|uniref:Uncharacterized protein n=1 Tax=Caenorhabditis remanei TaxID=31234 RepID=E3MXI5_CAERE|nr:hypothetical protein CRE_28924 [Caenorhabditis remanei]
MCLSIIALFENRFFVICSMRGNFIWEKFRPFWLIIHYIGVILIVIPLGMNVPNQEIALKQVFLRLPCLHPQIYEAPIFVMTDDITYPFIVCFSSTTFSVLEIVTFCLSLTWSILKQLKSGRMSRKTFEMQKRFFIALLIQVGVPFFVILFPFLYCARSVLFNYYNQAYMNCAIITWSIHGVVSTIAMVFIHQPYRIVILGVFRRRTHIVSNESSQRSLGVARTTQQPSIAPVHN